MGHPPARIGVILYEREASPDAALGELARRLKRRGMRVGGLIQRGQAGERDCADLYLDDIATGRSVAIFEKRGREASGCRLDSTGLAEAASWLRAAIEARPQVLFVNRFGRQEAEGRGVLHEIATAILADIPIVIAVATAHWPDWRAFACNAGTVLAGVDALEAWCLTAVGATPVATAG